MHGCELTLARTILMMTVVTDDCVLTPSYVFPCGRGNIYPQLIVRVGGRGGRTRIIIFSLHIWLLIFSVWGKHCRYMSFRGDISIYIYPSSYTLHGITVTVIHCRHSTVCTDNIQYIFTFLLKVCLSLFVSLRIPTFVCWHRKSDPQLHESFHACDSCITFIWTIYNCLANHLSKNAGHNCGIFQPQHFNFVCKIAIEIARHFAEREQHHVTIRITCSRYENVC